MKYYPKLIKKEFITHFYYHEFWFQSLSFKIFMILRDKIREQYSLKKIKKILEKFLQVKKNAKFFYIFINSIKPVTQRKSPMQINKEFKVIEEYIKENIWTVQKDLYVSKIGKGIQKIKDKIIKTKKYFVKSIKELPPEICEHILTFVFIW